MDTGPSVQKRTIDLYLWSCHEALAFGRRPVWLTVLRLGWNPQNSIPGMIDSLFRKREAERKPFLPSRPPALAAAARAPRPRQTRRRPRSRPSAESADVPLQFLTAPCQRPADISSPPLMHALYLLLPALCILAIAYRYYSAFLATKVFMLDDSRKTPAHTKYDGANYLPDDAVGHVRPSFRGHHGRGPAGRPDAGGAVRLRAGLHLAGRGRLSRRRGARLDRAVGLGAPRRQVALRHRQGRRSVPSSGSSRRSRSCSS